MTTCGAFLQDSQVRTTHAPEDGGSQVLVYRVDEGRLEGGFTRQTVLGTHGPPVLSERQRQSLR